MRYDATSAKLLHRLDESCFRGRVQLRKHAKNPAELALPCFYGECDAFAIFGAKANRLLLISCSWIAFYTLLQTETHARPMMKPPSERSDANSSKSQNAKPCKAKQVSGRHGSRMDGKIWRHQNSAQESKITVRCSSLQSKEAVKSKTPGSVGNKTSGRSMIVMKAIEAWRSERVGKVIPPAALGLLTNSDLSSSLRPRPAASKEVAFVTPSFLPFLQEVAPDIAVNTLNNNYGGYQLPESTRAILAAPDEVYRQKKCGEAVRDLRENVTVLGNSGNRINDFSAVCLFPTSGTRLSKLQRATSLECAAAYQNYINYCLRAPSDASFVTAIHRVTGIVTAASNSLYKRSIICSGTLIERDRFLSARHCLAGLTGMDNKPLPAWVRTAAENKDLPIVGVRLPPEFKSQPLSDVMISEQAWRSTGDRSHDVVVLDLGLPATATPEPKAVQFAEPAYLSPVILIGFQRLAYNAMRLQARLKDEGSFDDDDLLRSGDWRKAFLFDSSPTCLLSKLSADDVKSYRISSENVIGHFCQSLTTTSGAGIFLSERGSSTPKLTAIASTRLLDYALESIGLPVESVRPSNTALVIGVDFGKVAGSGGRYILGSAKFSDYADLPF